MPDQNEKYPEDPIHAQTFGEIDPTGRSLNEAGAKADAGKPRVGLVLRDFSRALKEVSKVGTFGAIKYSDHGWVSVPNGINRYDDALFRHLMEPHTDTIDGQSDLYHMAHAAWNALAVLELMLREKEKYDAATAQQDIYNANETLRNSIDQLERR